MCHEGKLWRSDGISSVYYNREDRLLTFNMDTLGPVTLIQDAHVNMPYQSWELSPIGLSKVLLIVKTVFIELQIHIKVSDVTVRPWSGCTSTRLLRPSLELWFLSKVHQVNTNLLRPVSGVTRSLGQSFQKDWLGEIQNV